MLQCFQHICILQIVMSSSSGMQLLRSETPRWPVSYGNPFTPRASLVSSLCTARWTGLQHASAPAAFCDNHDWLVVLIFYFPTYCIWDAYNFDIIWLTCFNHQPDDSTNFCRRRTFLLCSFASIVWKAWEKCIMSTFPSELLLNFLNFPLRRRMGSRCYAGKYFRCCQILCQQLRLVDNSYMVGMCCYVVVKWHLNR